jgi:uncharacterized protein
MPIELSDLEARLLGSLIEKSLTTPDLYPLTLNSLVNACNQKSSREPVTHYDEATVARGLASLREKNLSFTKSESGNRAPKFGHRVENLLNGGTAREVGAICVLLLRGPQTPGEIKTRTERLCEFGSVSDVVTMLDELAMRVDGPFIARLPRQLGQKEARCAQLFTKNAAPAENPSVAAPLSTPPPARISSEPKVVSPTVDARLAGLEARVKALEATVAELQKGNAVKQDV